MVAIPDPEPYPNHDHSLYDELMAERPPTFRPGEIPISESRHDGFRVTDNHTGQIHEFDEIIDDPEDPESVLGRISTEDSEQEARWARMKRIVRESHPLKYVSIDRKTGAEIAVVVAAVAVGSLVVRRRRKKD